MTRFFAWGTGVRGGRGSRLSVVRGRQPTGSGRLAPRCALVGKKGWDARMGLVVPPNRLRAALAARCPSAADGVRGGSVRGGLWFEAGSRWGVRWAVVRGGNGSMLSVARGGQPPGDGRLAPRFALVGNKDRGCDGGSSCLQIGEPLRSLSVARRLLMGCEVGVFEAGWGSRWAGARGREVARLGREEERREAGYRSRKKRRGKMMRR